MKLNYLSVQMLPAVTLEVLTVPPAVTKVGGPLKFWWPYRMAPEAPWEDSILELSPPHKKSPLEAP